MQTVIQAIFSSVGFKRLVASIVIALIPVFAANPGTVWVVPILSWVAAGVGAAALIHAVFKDTLQVSWIGSFVSFLQLLIIILGFIPQAQTWIPVIQAIASALGALSVPKLARVSLDGALRDD